jgi:selenocysteine-specific elongation factor
VSAKTFEGYPEFYGALAQQIKGIVKRRRCGVFRMPIERVFARPGFGAVVTGIPVDGAIALGDQVEVVPGGQLGKVRGIQRFLRDVERGEYGQCLALNVPELSKKPPARGQVVCAPGYLATSPCFHVQIKVVPSLEKPLRNAEEIKFHTGTVEEPGKIYLFGEKALPAGSDALAFVVLHYPVAAAAGDRCILRRASPPATVAGGEIVEIGAAEQRANKKQILDRLQERRDFLAGLDPVSPEGIDKRTEYVLLRERPTGAPLDAVSKATLLPLEAARASIARLVEAQKVSALADDYFIHTDNYRACVAEVEARLEKAGKDDHALSLTLSDLRKDFNWPAPLWNRIQGEMERRNLVRRKGEKMILQAAVRGLSDADRALMDRLVGLYRETGYHSPRPDELPERLGVPADRIARLLDYLCSEGQLIRVAKSVVLSYEHFKKAQDAVVAAILEKGTLNSADFKYVIDSSRKYALAVLDYLDSKRVTIRIGNDRKLTADYRKYLI